MRGLLDPKHQDCTSSFFNTETTEGGTQRVQRRT